MSSEFNSFRNRRYIRSRFLDGRFLLSQEATDIELEMLEYTRRIVANLLGDTAVGNAWLTQAVPSSLGISNYQNKLIVRPGVAYKDGLLFEMASGLDDRVSASANQPATIGSPNDAGGKIMDFTSLATGYYKIIAQAIEEDVNGSQDTFLQGAAVPETTQEKRRLIYSLNAVPSDVNGNLGPTSNSIGNTSGIDPNTFTTTGASGPATPQQISFFTYNDVFKVPVTPNTIVSASDTLGSSCAVTFSNVSGGGVLFPTGTIASQIFSGGLLIDPDGTVYFINAVQVTTGPDQITFTLDQELAVPAGSGLQSQPNLGTSGLRYTLVAADTNVASAATDSPIGTRNYAVANVYWNGSNFNTSPWGFSSSEGSVNTNIEDLRSSGTQESIENLASKVLWETTGGGDIHWNLTTQDLSWDADITVKVPNNPSLQYVISASDTQTLFSSNFVEDEVLYFVVPSANSGSISVTLQKDARGTNDLLNTDPSELYILAYRTLNRIHFIYDSLVLGDGETGGLGQGLYNQYMKLVRGGDWTNYPTQVNTLVAQQATTSSNVASSSNAQWYAQPFTPSGSGNLGQVTLYPYITGSPTGTFTVKILADNSGLPGPQLSSSFPINIASLGSVYPGLALNVPFFIPTGVSASTQYWILIDTTNATLSGGNTLNFNDDTASPVAYTSTDSGSTWTSLSTLALEFQAYTSVNGSGQTLYWDLPAYIQMNGNAENRNQLPPGNIVFANDGDVAYVTVNRGAGSPANLSISIANISAIPANENTFIVARRTESSILVGAQSFALASGESSLLDASIGVTPGPAGNNLVSDGIRWVSSSGGSQVPSSMELLNVGLAASSSSNNLVVALKQQDGLTDPSPAAPVKIAFRSPTLTSGSFNERSVTSTLDITAPSGTSFGLPDAPPVDIAQSGGTQNSIDTSSATSTWLGQSFTAAFDATLTSVILDLRYTAGSGLTGNLVVGLYTDSAGSPGTLLATSSPVDSSTITTSFANYEFDFTGGPILSDGTMYHLVLNPTSVTFGSSILEVGSDNTDPYSGGTAESSSNSGGTWTVTAGTDYIFTVNGLQVKDQNIYVYALDNLGVVELALAGSNNFDEGEIYNTEVMPTSVASAESLTVDNQSPSTALFDWIGQSFTSSFTGNINNAIIQLSYVGGTGVSGDMVVHLYTDSSGLPGTLIETSAPINASLLTSTPTNFTFLFSGSTLLSDATAYHIVWDPTSVGSFGGGTINLSYSDVNPYIGGNLETSSNSGGTWAPQVSDDAYFIINATLSSDDKTLYSTTARSNVPIRLIGRITVEELIAGIYADPPTAVALQPFKQPFITNELVMDTFYGTGSAAYGSVDTAVFRYLNTIKNSGTAFTVLDSLEHGTQIQINEPGYYVVSASIVGDGIEADNAEIFISINASGSGLTSANSLLSSQIIALAIIGAAAGSGGVRQYPNVSGPIAAQIGDIIRIQSDSNISANGIVNRFRILKMSK